MRARLRTAARPALAGLLLLAAGLPGAVPAETARDAPAPERPASEPAARATERAERPEYRTRPLPADTFEPSEQVSEDYPVPFPEDI